MALLEVSDLTPFATIDPAKAGAMVVDAVALATMVAPCLANDSLTPLQAAAAKAILRGAVLRWNDSGSGAVSQQVAGPFQMSIDTKQARRTMFWPSEVIELQRICKGGGDGGAFSIDTAAQPMRTYTAFCGFADDGIDYLYGPNGFDQIPPPNVDESLDGGNP